MDKQNKQKKQENTSSQTEFQKSQTQLQMMWSSLWENKASVWGLGFILLLIFIAVFAQFLMPYDPNASNMAESFLRPSSEHWFGTDQLGRDIFSRVIAGTRISLMVGVSAVAVSLIIGIILGAIAGYYGGMVDTIIMRIMDMMLAIPSILLAITFMAAMGKGIDKAILAIGLVSIPEYARIVRGSILSVKQYDYVQAAKVIGNRDSRIIFRHILPNILSSIIVRATLGISTAVLETAALGFLGLGVQPPTAEWMCIRDRSTPLRKGK